MSRLNSYALIAICSVTVGCADADERYDSGYNDGFAAGYNTACEIRATLIEGDFDNKDYSRGFTQGQSDGIIECNRDRAAGRI